MIEEILPEEVIAVEAREDASDIGLFPQERLMIERAVEKRRLEFTTARACARSHTHHVLCGMQRQAQQVIVVVERLTKLDKRIL